MRLRKRLGRRKTGLIKPKCRTRILPGQIRGFTIHYSGSLADRRKDHSECDDVWRAFQKFHMAPGGLGVPEGGCDIAYNFGFCPHGYTLVGRGWNNRSGANGTTEANRRHLSVVVLGGDREERRDVTAEAERSLVRFRRRLRIVHPLAREIGFHSSWVNTGCPGDELRARARRLWRRARFV